MKVRSWLQLAFAVGLIAFAALTRADARSASGRAVLGGRAETGPGTPFREWVPPRAQHRPPGARPPGPGSPS